MEVFVQAGDLYEKPVAGIYSSVFSKEELTSLGAFYSTPAGQSMVAKQPPNLVSPTSLVKK